MARRVYKVKAIAFLARILQQNLEWGTLQGHVSRDLVHATISHAIVDPLEGRVLLLLRSPDEHIAQGGLAVVQWANHGDVAH